MLVEEEIDIDAILPIVGGFGPFQWECTLALCLMVVPATYQVLIMYFAALQPNWRCSKNSTVCLFNGTQDSTNKFLCTIARDEWEFTEPRSYSVATYFDIYCSNVWLLDLATASFFIGAAAGGLILGTLADKRGRKFVLFVSLLSLILIGLISVLSPNIYVFFACRFIAGAFYAGTLAQMIVLNAELVEWERRPFAANSVWLFYSSALCVLSLKAYFIRKWKILLVVCTAPYLLMLSFYNRVPESVRWLVLKQRLNEVEATFKKIANRNNRDYPEGMIRANADNTNSLAIEPDDTRQTKSSFIKLFWPMSVALRTLIQAYAWFATSMVYYGLSLSADELGGSMYLNFALVSLMECPGHITSAFLSHRFGRKKTAAIPMLMACISCIIIPNMPASGSVKVARVVMGMLGKFFITITHSCIYLWSAEMVCVSNRAKGIGLLQVFEMMGGACAPFIAKELELVNVKAPFLVYGGCALICSVLMSFLPETKGNRLD